MTADIRYSSALDALRLEALGGGRFAGHSLPTGTGVVHGGQLMGQMIVAARTVVPDQRVRSIHALLVRTVDPAKPSQLVVELIRAGRGFSSVAVDLQQDGRTCARGLLMHSADEPDVIRYGATMPEARSPEDSEPMDEPVELETIPGEIRVFQGPLLLPKGDIAAPEYSFWFRSQGAPDDAAIQQALLIPPTLMFLIGVALRPQRLSQDQAHISVDTGVLAHTVTFHDEARVNDWLLVTMESPQSGAGCTFGRGHVFSRGGTLLASFEQENMVRAMRAHSRLLPS